MTDLGVQYDEQTQTLTLTFPNGTAYDFTGVPPDIVQKLNESDDRMRFYNRYIRGMY